VVFRGYDDTLLGIKVKVRKYTCNGAGNCDIIETKLFRSIIIKCKAK
jgi:hypothetical protein